MAWLDPLTKRFRFRSVLNKIDQLGIRPPSRVLDAGCGDESFTRLMRQRGFTVISADKCSGDYYIDLENTLPFSDGEFDLAVSLAVAEHLYNWKQFLEELKRVASVVIITTPSPHAKGILEILSMARLINRSHIKDHKHYISSDELISVGYSVDKFLWGLNQIAYYHGENTNG